MGHSFSGAVLPWINLLLCLCQSLMEVRQGPGYMLVHNLEPWVFLRHTSQLRWLRTHLFCSPPLTLTRLVSGVVKELADTSLCPLLAICRVSFGSGYTCRLLEMNGRDFSLPWQDRRQFCYCPFSGTQVLVEANSDCVGLHSAPPPPPHSQASCQSASQLGKPS